ncbi:hypothetical protein P7G51_07705 [Enterococcus asini]|uniref:hypothetical protein n=1 Tax=Enterococcus asini TaxID=57732 RepID=UPI0028925D7B|nr:hypothetical protein [Enterococcus asini]MDT2757262.1 hypothetical protein [Enterococcus asini]
MSEPDKENLEKLAKEAKNDDTFEKLDEMEEELNLDEEPVVEDKEEEKPEDKSALEKIIEDVPPATFLDPNNRMP